jgi:hypothetical protein
MKTNLEKWNYYYNLIKQKENDFINSIVSKKPEILYLVLPKGVIKTQTITSLDYSYRMNGECIFFTFYTRKPTRKDVKKLKEYFEANIKYKKELIRFNYSESWGKGFTSSSTHFFLDPKRNINITQDLSKAKIISERLVKENKELNNFKEQHKKDSDYNYKLNGYKFLGWQNGWKYVYYDEDGNLCSETNKPRKTFGYLTSDYPEYGKCRDLKHRHIEVSHNQRGSENTVSCPICKIYWKYDCSD